MKNSLLILVILLLASGLTAQSMTVNVQLTRFQDGKNTAYNIDYQIPYRSLVFMARQNGFFAEVDVRFQICNKDSALVTKDFSENIGISSKLDAQSNYKAFLDRISLTLSRPGYILRLRIIDINSQKVFKWEYKNELLEPDALLSDLEICSVVRSDSTAYLSKFKRNGILYQSEPSGLISAEVTDSLFIYYDVMVPELSKKKSDKIKLETTCYKDGSEVFSSTREYTPKALRESTLTAQNILDLKPGIHQLGIKATYMGKSTIRKVEFSIVIPIEDFRYIFPDMNEEMDLMRYFRRSGFPTNWESMTNDSKRRYSTNFWRNMAAQSNLTLEAMITLLQDRINYCNKYFTHFKPGWTTDMGRIYIRNGAADEVIKDQSSDETRFVRKEYQIWKYQSSSKNAVYIFIDKQMNGNYQLIYARNDETETTQPDWIKYLGSDFDESILNN